MRFHCFSVFSQASCRFERPVANALEQFKQLKPTHEMFDSCRNCGALHEGHENASVSRTLPWLNHGKVARDAGSVMAEADDTAATVCKALQDGHEKGAKYFKRGNVKKYALRENVWVQRHHKDVLSRHRQASWYVTGVIVRTVGQDVFAVRVGDNKILDRDHTQLRHRAPDPSDVPSPSSSQPEIWTSMTRVRTTTSPPRGS